AECSAPGSVRRRLLSVDAAAHGGAGVHIRGAYAGRECSVSPRAACVEHFDGVSRVRPPGCQHLFLLQLCRSFGPRAGHYGHDRHFATDVVLAGVYWRTDCLEWCQLAPKVAACWQPLTRFVLDFS